MTDVDSLLAAVCANIEADDPRLQFADALLERSEPGDEEWAELIRLQIDESTGSSGLSASVRIMAAQSLFAESGVHQKKWLGGIHDVTVPGSDWRDTYSWWSRGFPELVRCDAISFSKYGRTFLWNPKETERCPGCDRCKQGMIYTGKDGMKWIECRRPRPCPPTARPVRRVTLTTYPDFEYKTVGTDTFDYPVVCGRMTAVPKYSTEKQILEAAFTGVKFVLPKLMVTVNNVTSFGTLGLLQATVESAGFIKQGDRIGSDAEGRAVRVDPNTPLGLIAGIAAGDSFVVQEHLS